MRRFLAPRILLVAALVAPAASAQKKGAPTAEEAKKNGAREHFNKGVPLMQAEQWDAALVEFNASIEQLPTKNARKNAAECLKQLGRFAEALDEYELLLKEFGPQLSPQDKDLVAKAVEGLTNVTGFIVVESSEAGATVVVDSKTRGTTPLPGPIRIGQGTHTIRVSKEGYVPFETTTPVLGKQTVTVAAKLATVARAGSLTVIEETGAEAEVIVDGAVRGKVGKAPFQEKIGPGSHWVSLRGAGNLGTQPAPVKVDHDGSATLRLTLEELPGDARIETEPVGAAIVLDGVPVGQGSWAGRLRSGSHKVTATQDGYFATSKTFDITTDTTATVKVVLERDENSPLWVSGRVRKISVGVFGGGVYGLFGMGGDYERSCSNPGTECYERARGLGFVGGVRGGYEVAPGLSVELDLGYAYVSSSLSRKTILSGENQAPVNVDITDTWSLSGFVVGAGAAYRIVRAPIAIYGALAGGVILGGRVRDRRSGNFACLPPESATDCSGAETRDPPSPRPMPPFGAQVSKTIPWIAPEVRFGLPLNDAMQIGVSIGAFIGITDARPAIRQAPQKTSPTDTPEIPPRPGDTTRRPIGVVPALDAPVESAIGTFVLPRVAVFFRLAF